MPITTSLAAPPRSVPLTVRLRLLLGGFHNQFGWAFFGSGLVFVWVFGGANLLVSAVHYSGELETARGVVTRVEEAGYSINESKVHRYHYEFRTADRTAYAGASDAFAGRCGVGDPVTVEHPKGDPARSRVRDLNTGMGGAGMYAAMLFTVVGLGFIGVGVRKGLKGVRLLCHGQQAVGTMISRRPTLTRINGRTVYEFVFRFRAGDGESYEARARTHRPEELAGEAEAHDGPPQPGEGAGGEDGPGGPVLEPLLYDPASPRRAVLLDDLPGGPRIDEYGQIRARHGWKVLLTMVIPTATAVGHGRYVLSLLA